MQSAQSVSAAYYRNLAARDYTLAAGAIELVVEGVPCSALIEPSQSCELIFCARLDRLQGRKHAGDGCKFRRDLQEQNGHAMKGRERKLPMVDSIGRSTLGGGRKASRNSRTTIKIGNKPIMNRVQDGGLVAPAPATPIGRKTKQQTITRVLRKLETSLTITAGEPALLRRQFSLAADTKKFPDASVDLVYLDPPFNSNAE